MATTTHASGKIPADAFYGEYHGHTVAHLDRLLSHLRRSTSAATASTNTTTLLWTAGDSSLDNKHWFQDIVSAPRAYADVLDPPHSKPDVTYWLNQLLSEESYCCEKNVTASAANHSNSDVAVAAINAAVEEGTLNERTFRLRPQDVFLRDNIQPHDILIVSVGGNDVALKPTFCTILSIAGLVVCLPTSCTEHGCTCGALPCDDRCGGCGPSLLSCLLCCACPPCLGYLRHLFGVRLHSYISKLTARTKPSKVLVCMIYHPDEQVGVGWAGPALNALAYNHSPDKLQSMIRKVFVEATSTIRIPGIEVVPVPLFRVLDGKNTTDYIDRVEPSPSGGKKMAEFLLHHAFPSRPRTSQNPATYAAPSSSLIQGRG